MGSRAAFLFAHCLGEGGQSGEARTLFDAVASRYPPLAAYARLYAAELVLQSGATDEAVDRLARLLAQPLSSPVAQRARLAYAQALVKAGRPAAAEPVLQGLPEAWSDDETAAQVWWLRGMAAEATGARTQATRAYAMTWWAVPENRYVEDAARRLRDLSGGYLPSPPLEARMMRARLLLARGRAPEAERELVSVLHTGPPPPIAAEAWYRLGFVRLRSAGAGYAFLQAARDPARAASALYWTGRALTSVNRDDDARIVWLRVWRQYPASPWAARSLLALALRAEARGARTEADALLSRVAIQYPASPSGDEARWRRGWARWRSGRYADAEALLMKAGRDFPLSSHAAGNFYWAAKARERRGKDPRPLLEATARRYALTYYGQRARARLGWGAPAPVLPQPPRMLPPNRFAETHEELGALGFDMEAATEAETVYRFRPDRELRHFVAFHWARAGKFHASVAAVHDEVDAALRGGGSADAESWALAYPRAFWELVSRAATEAGIDPYLALAVIREESRFDPRAVSPAGAMGLMQLLPSTARGQAGGPIVPEQLMDPEVNIRLGTAYLGALLRAFHGDVVLALAAYNAGAAAARRFARLSRDDRDVLIENIPFAETRVYVQNVLESYGIYRWLYR